MNLLVKKEEQNDIIQYLIPKLEEKEIPKENCKVDVTTDSTGQKRGDIWISTKSQNKKGFERNIIALIEAKHRNSTVGDLDWKDAMEQGKEKAQKENLDFYIVTNCTSEVRFYNAHNDEEIKLDGKVITRFQPLDILQKIDAQIDEDTSYVSHNSKFQPTVSEKEFQQTLTKLADTYRSAGLKKGDQRIDPTISFVVLKYISEKESEKRTLDKSIPLWNDLEDVAKGKKAGNLKADFKKMVNLIWEEDQYKDNQYRDFKNLVTLSDKLKDAHYKKIYKELDKYHLHGANFDLFGSIYEEFASQSKKKEFGEFYTRRHITGVIARSLLKDETVPRDLKICDPACGSGGFLIEAYNTLQSNYDVGGKLNDDVLDDLQTEIFWGYDYEQKSVARTKLNMFLAGDGHLHIYENDSLVGWNKSIEYQKNNFDYILANPPMGRYNGEADKENFDYTNRRRYELFFLEKIVEATKPGGEIGVIINDGTLESPSKGGFRKKLLKNCKINAIVSLPKYAFAPYTKEKTYVLFMQKKQKEERGRIQETPIWHFIVDYDGYANSDKRYPTKYHNDLPELEEKYEGAIELISQYKTEKRKFESEKNKFEREVNEREKSEGLKGKKYSYVPMSEVNEENYHNLLSEYHLRPYKVEEIEEEEFEEKIQEVKKEIKTLKEGV